ncbi:glycosyltransferase family 39 protein [Patescibacteria group bacterium]|nr:MAG: glycosyltransferase family 39 protein [Patescibacteria group bacterium]
MKLWIRQHRVALALTTIMLIAAFMRLWQLDNTPPGLHPDEAANGLDVFDILQGHLQVFFERNGGREGLFFYLQAVGVSIFGNTILGLRIAPALLGTAAVAAVYLWAASWFNRRTALIAALFMAVTPWAVIISRDGFRASMLMLMIPLTLWLITKAIRSNRWYWFAGAGVSFGLGFYTYIAYRMFPLALVAAAAFVLIWRRNWIQQYWRGLAVFGLAAAIVLIPLGLYAIGNPSAIAGRPGGVSFANPDLNHGNPIGTLADSTIKTVLMFNVHGDENYRHGMGGESMLNLFVGIMFVLGIIIAISRIKRLSYFALLMVFGSMLLPAALTAEGLPHGLRSVGALAPAVVLAALGTNFLLYQWQRTFPLNPVARNSGTAAIVILLALTVYHGYASYFIAWANSPEVYKSYSEENVALSEYYNANPVSGKRYVVAGDYTLQTVQYLTHNKSQWQSVDPQKVDGIPLEPGVAKEFAIFSYDKDKALERLRLKFPKGTVSPYYSPVSNDELYVLYRVPAQ